ncbi:hypothetical protein V6N12_074533 [Hibiscus sabdariffa]|uniref:MADS-box domain-containing protein n=1 Tax=Hibiscus sabdariffa TaxID=183260 RepID=A0ABR2AN72_9ROSI
MKIIEKEGEKLVTFSKRRSGIYKKISEITVLCGTNILFICFSPEGTTVSQVAEQRRRLIFQVCSIHYFVHQYCFRRRLISQVPKLQLRNYLRLVRRTGGLRILVLHQWGIIVRDAREMGRVFVQGMYALENGHDDMPLYFDNMSFEGLLDVGELIGRSGTSLRVATIRANLRRRRFLPITAQPTAEAEKCYFCPSQPNLLSKLKNVVSVYNEATRQIDGAKEKEKTHAGQQSGRETNFWWEATIDWVNLQELEELEFRYAKHVNELEDSLSASLDKPAINKMLHSFLNFIASDVVLIFFQKDKNEDFP